MSDATVTSDRATWLYGPPAKCSVGPNVVPGRRPRRLVLLGAPGVGKGTQAELLCERLGACHLSTGDVFRAARSNCACPPTPAMAQALEYMRAGELVPDETVLAVVRERVRCVVCGGGFLLDGFPRTVPQALALEEILKSQGVALDAVLDFHLPIDEIVQRLSGRRACTQCKATRHVSQLPPDRQDVCDRCGGQLRQRDDDRPDAVRTRMAAYARSTAPLTDFYAMRGLLVRVEAHGTPEEVYARAAAALASVAQDGR